MEREGVEKGILVYYEGTVHYREGGWYTMREGRCKVYAFYLPILPYLQWDKIFQTEKTIEIHLVRLTDVCGKVLSDKYAYKSVKTALLLSNVIDVDHQNSCLFTNNGHFSLPLWVFIGVLAKLHD